MDNETQAPMIPQGTEKTVYGTPTFEKQGQAQTSPDVGQVGTQIVQPESLEAPKKGITFEELAAKKGFKSADDLADAYQNLESQTKRVEMGLAELSKIREQPEVSSESGEEPITSSVETQEDAVKVVEKIVKKFTRPLEDKLALQELFFKNQDASQYAIEMAEIVKKNPGIAWDVAYKAAKFDALQTTAKREGKEEAYQTMQMKEAAAVAPSKPSSKEAAPIVDLIRDKSIPFVEIQRIMKERFSP